MPGFKIFCKGDRRELFLKGRNPPPILSSPVCPKVLFLAPYYFLYTSTTSPTKPAVVQSVSLLMIASCTAASKPGFEINARPLARGDWKPRGMSRIFAQVVRRASGYFNLFSQLGLYETLNETNY